MSNTLRLTVPADADTIYLNMVMPSQTEKILEELILEVPLDEATVQSSGFNRTLCSLYLRMNDSIDEHYIVAANLLEINKPPGKIICVAGYNARNIKKINIQGDYNCNLQYEYCDYCIVKDINVLAILLEKWSSERLIIFYVDEEQCDDIFAKVDKAFNESGKWYEYSKSIYWSPEEPFLTQIDTCELFISYNISRAVYDLYGKRHNIINFYEKAKGMLL